MDEPTLRHIYVKPDETVEDRRRAMLKKLYSRALQEGKDVRMSENDGQLFVDDTLFFSVKDGFVESRIINRVVKLPVIYFGGKLPVTYR